MKGTDKLLVVLGCCGVIWFYVKSRSFKIEFENGNKLPEGKNGCYVVPNYVHFLRLGRPQVSFVEAVCLLAALKNQSPDHLFVHAERRPSGPYWEIVREAAGPSLRLLKIRPLSTVFGQTLSPRWRAFHASDVLRIKILATYGGIFLDNDSYVVRSLDEFRRYEMSLGWLPGKYLQNQIIVAKKDAKFLKKWLESYKGNYNASLWYYNAGELPTEILKKDPGLIHSAGRLFGNYGVVRKLFEGYWPDWRGYYSFHLMARHQYMFRNVTKIATYPVQFDENVIHKYPITFREMVYDVYPY